MEAQMENAPNPASNLSTEMKIMLFLVRVSCRVGCFPVDFRPEINGIAKTKYIWKYYLIIFQMIFAWCYFCFAMFQLILMLQSKGQLNYIIFHVIMICIQFLSTVIQWTSLNYTEELVDLIAFMFNYEKYRRSELDETGEFIGTMDRTKLLKVALGLVTSAIFTFWAVFFVAPNNVYYIYSIFPRNWKNPLTYLIFAFVIEGRALLQYLLYILIPTGFGLVYCQNVTIWTIAARSLMTQKVLTDESKFQVGRTNYNGFIILNTLFNKVFGNSLWLPSILIVITLVLPMSVYGIVKMADRLDIISFSYLCLAIPCIVGMNLGIYYPMIEVEQQSIQISESTCINDFLATYIRVHKENPENSEHILALNTADLRSKCKFLKASFRSAQPIRCSLLSFGVVDEKAKRNLLQTLIDLTIYLLLTF